MSSCGMCRITCSAGPRASRDTTGGSCCNSAARGYTEQGRRAPKILKMAELMTAVKTGDLQFVQRLFSMFSQEEAGDVVKYQTPETRETFLFSACVKGQVEMARFLLSVGRGQRDVGTAWGAVPLHAAAERSHEAVVRLLLTNGADMNAQTSYGDTPLHLAAYRGNYAIVRCLVEAGCNLNIVNSKGRTALDDASAARHGRIVQYLGAVMNLGNEDFAKHQQERKKDNDKIDLMKTRPLVPPIKLHQMLDRSISWHSCPSDILQGNSDSWPEGGATDTWRSGRRHSALSSLGSESSGNDLSMATAGSPRWDAHSSMNVIPEVSNDAGNQQHQQLAATSTATQNHAAARTCAEKRRDYRNRSASDSRVEYLEKMVEHLRLGLASTQEELGRTRLELRRAKDSLRLSPCGTNTEDGPGCVCRPNDTVRLVLNVRDRDF
ncbi:E3 ubiquitin-protein ligase mind-bomb-like [Patiria miniata]|uniref:Uncharacterized protein n=1 Tax=Patiria miniata TaxID=46514 RepID=A0A914AXB3_PATMI|nr:E3 ubiquitin-protein ligase mind-bomb-like [Patiria miniata]